MNMTSRGTSLQLLSQIVVKCVSSQTRRLPRKTGTKNFDFNLGIDNKSKTLQKNNFIFIL